MPGITVCASYARRVAKQAYAVGLRRKSWRGIIKNIKDRVEQAFVFDAYADERSAFIAQRRALYHSANSYLGEIRLFMEQRGQVHRRGEDGRLGGLFEK